MPQEVEVSVTIVGDQIVVKAIGNQFKLVSETPPPPPPPPPPDPDPDPEPTPAGYIWADVTTFPSKPRSGAGWDAMYSFAKGDAPGPVSVSDQNSKSSAWAHACSYVYAATGDTAFLNKTLGVFRTFVSPSLAMGRALALARELQGYVAAAEGIQLAKVDAALDVEVKAKIKYLLTAQTKGGGPDTLIKSMEERPNNWGTHALAAVLMSARYIGDKALYDHAITIFRGYLGDRSAYSGYIYGDDLSWQSNPKEPVGINPLHATIDGHDVDGALPEEMRRGGSFAWPLPKTCPTTYPWEANQGSGAGMYVALNAGDDLRPASNWAHKRNVLFLLNNAHWPIQGDDAFLIPVLNLLYSDLNLDVIQGTPGKGLAWTQWSHI